MLQGDKKSVLVIDDDLIIRKLLNFHLSKSNFNVHLAQSPEEGFSALYSKKIDLVLCDVGLEGMDGYTFCQKVREHERYRTLPFIFLSAKEGIEEKEKALAVGADDYLTKPFNIQELTVKILSLIRRTEILTIYGRKNTQQEKPVENTGQSKVLLVDDDPAISKLFSYNLTKAGFICKTAVNGAEGFSLAESFMPDIIISDIMMPEVDGFQFRKRLLDDNELKSIPFIFLTAKGAEEDIMEGYDLGITDYVIKTSGPRVIIAKVNAILNSIGKVKQKMVSDLHKAADSMRVKVVSDILPSLPGFEISQWHKTFEGIPGGDFIDYFELPDSRILIVLGDVMGKKWNAWYFAVAYAGYIRSALRVAIQNSAEYSPKSLVENVNSIIYNDSKISEVFSTLSVLLLDSNTNSIKYCGAGDLPLIHKHSNTSGSTQIKSPGLLLGFSPSGFYEESQIPFEDKDELFLFTDGIIESRNSKGESLGIDNFTNIITSIPQDNSSLPFIQEYMSSYLENKFEDDISIVSIKIKKG